MHKAGLMRIGAMLAVLAVVCGALAALPYWTAQGVSRKISGYIDECVGPGPSFLGSVNVTLVDAHGLRDAVTTRTTGDGHYAFLAPPTGSYILKFSLAQHYNNETAPFRFDGSVDVPIDRCLTPMPPRTGNLGVLVVNQITSAYIQESLTARFARTIINNENIACGVDVTGTWRATVSHHPVVRPGYSFSWGATSLVENADYWWVNLFAGIVQINNSAIRTSLSAGCLGKWLNVTYQWSATSVRLLHYPVVPSSYSVYKGAPAWPGEGINWTLNVDTGVFSILANFIFGIDSVSISYSSTGAIADATVFLYNNTARQEVARGTTNATGYVILPIWPAVLSLQASKDQYQPYEASINTGAVNTTRVVLPNAVKVYGLARKADGSNDAVNTNVVGYLYNVNPVPRVKKLIAASVTQSLYIFYAEPGQTYRMVIDADGYRAAETTVTAPLTGSFRSDVFLSTSPKEQYRSVVSYGTADWNNITIYRNLTLLSDTTFPGLEEQGIRSLGLQIDSTPGIGNGNGVLEAGEVALFRLWLQSRLADYITTDGFLTTNKQAHNSTGTYTVAPIDVRPSLANPAWFFVNTTATYKLSTTPLIPSGKPKYFVNVTTPNDSNTTVYRDQVVEVHLPKGYEMTDKKITGSITTTGFTTVTVDPGITTAATSEIDMTIQRSANGTARARAESPPGKFFVIDDSLKNYTAVVAANARIAFSANLSTDPVGNIRDANFTWNFTNNTAVRSTQYGIWSAFNYTVVLISSLGHFFVVNLTVVEAGGNHTYRDFKVYIDDTPPIAVIRTNRTGANVNANGTTLRINEDVLIRFDGSGSTDTAYATAPAWLNNHKSSIPDVEGSRGYRWDFDSDRIVDSNMKVPVHAYAKPGYWNATLQVVDWVGHKSTVNATLHVIANDTTKPTPNFVILDPSNKWLVTTSLIENREYAFNASSSSDNYDENKNLTFKWYFPGPVVNRTGALVDGHNFTGRGAAGWNITVKWTAFNLSYNVTLNVTDRGFGPNPLGPNWGNRTVSVSVSVDVAVHPDLKYVAGTFRIEPGQPEEGQQINVSFMVENDKSRANATSVTIVLTAKDSGGTVVLSNSNPAWRDDQWHSLADRRIDSGKKVRLVFTISFSAQGNKSLEIRFHDAAEPYTWVDGQNRVTGTVFVKLAGWVIPAAFVGIIGLVIGVALGLRTYSRYKSGELVFRRKEKKEKKEKKKLEEKEEEPEEKEEVEDTKGKRRL